MSCVNTVKSNSITMLKRVSFLLIDINRHIFALLDLIILSKLLYVKD